MMDTSPTHDPSHYYARLWRRVIVDFLGRDPKELDHLLEQWRDGMGDPNGIFYHEAPEYYIAPVLVPAHLNSSLSPYHWERLCWAIYPVIGRYDRKCGLDDSCFDAMRRDLKLAIDNWLVANRPDLLDAKSEQSG